MIVRDLISLDGEWPDLGPISGDSLARLYYHEPDLYRSMTTDFWAAIARNGTTHG